MTIAQDFSFTGLDGKPLPLSDFKGRALLVVNTASRCGFTPQYRDLQSVWARYRDSGLVGIGVPCNQFGGQEPGEPSDILRFCAEHYGIDFPMTAKVDVKGGQAHPFYSWIAGQVGFFGRPHWNFYKYLIGRDGRLRTWFSTVTNPRSGKVAGAIDKALARD